MTEPTDAQIEAAITASWGDDTWKQWNEVEQRDEKVSMRAALRAAGVVAEEPEWEYGYELIESDTRDVLTRSGAFESVEAARHWANKAHKAESDPGYPPLDVLIVRRRKAGPWGAVK